MTITNERITYMKNKLIALLLCTTIAFASIGCSSDSESVPIEQETVTAESEADTSIEDVSENNSTEKESIEESTEESTTEDLNALGDIEVDENLLSVEITLPPDFTESLTTQEAVDASVEESGYKSGTLNSDGSVTYVMTKSMHTQILEEMSININTSLDEMVGSESTPNITDISANDDFTEFTVTTKSTELDMTESFSVLTFYMYGGMYGIFTGVTPDNVTVTYINADSGEVIETANSEDME